MKAPRNLIGSCPMKGTEAPLQHQHGVIWLPRCCVDCQGVPFGDLCPHSRPFKPAVHVLQEFLAAGRTIRYQAGVISVLKCGE